MPSPVPVGEFVAEITRDLRNAHRSVEVTGEATGVHAAASGHVYFQLHDHGGMLNCVLYAYAARGQPSVKSGRAFVVRGGIDVYGARGQLQLKVSSINPLNQEGDREALRSALIETLRTEGIFDRPRRTLPTIPHHVCIITSLGSAAHADMQAGIASRWATLRTTFIDARVQGEGASESIVAALDRADALEPPVSVIILGRGGGSEDDLWQFNESRVVRRLVASKGVTISAVGHESDCVISDMVADVRAKTPTAAVELAVPHRSSLEEQLAELRSQARASATSAIFANRTRIENLANSLFYAPVAGMVASREKLSSLQSQLCYCFHVKLAANRCRLRNLFDGTVRAPLTGLLAARQHLSSVQVVRIGKLCLARYRQSVCSARVRLTDAQLSALCRLRGELGGIKDRLESSGSSGTSVAATRLNALQTALDACDPQQMLRRGFVIVRNEQGCVITNSAEAARCDILDLQFGDGGLRIYVDRKRKLDQR